MPWSHSVLSFAKMDSIQSVTELALPKNAFVSDPNWLSDDEIIYLSDKDGWINFYRYSISTKSDDQITSLEAEFGSPDWMFQDWHYDIIGEKIVTSYVLGGATVLCLVGLKTKHIEKLSESYLCIQSIRASKTKIFFLGTTSTTVQSLFALDLDTKQTIVVRECASVKIDDGYISKSQNLTFDCLDGAKGHMIYYPPQNKDFKPFDNEIPPCLFHCHGGPTSQAEAGLQLAIQFWTSRGFAYVDVDYGMNI
jgi:dipeptidyl aminopeptidase/acylaminoacyl peptidase